jgi:GntR family transcriptional regulator
MNSVEINGINPESPLPRFMQIEQDLRRQILSGALKSGAHLPRETELALRYGASRMTVRRALEMLAEAQLIRRAQGVGTIVTPPSLPITCDVDLMVSVGEQLRQQGHDPEVMVDLHRLTEAPESVAQALGLGVGDMAVVVRRVTSVGKRPIMLNISWLPAGLFPGMESRALVDGSLWKTLAQGYGLKTVRADNRVEIVMASSEESRLLLAEEGTPIMRLTSVLYDQKNRAVEHSTMFSSANVRCRFSSRVAN